MFSTVTRTSLCLKVRTLSRPRNYEYHRLSFLHRRCSNPLNINRHPFKHRHCNTCLLENVRVNTCVLNQRFYSDFKDDDMVKSWIKDIRNDFETNNKSKANETSGNNFETVEAIADAAEKKVQLDKNSNMSEEEQLSFKKLEEFAKKYAGVETLEEVADTSSSDSDSDLVSSASSESDTSDDEVDSDKKMVTSDQIESIEAPKGFTKEEMIELLKTRTVTDTRGSDTEDDVSSDIKTEDVVSNVSNENAENNDDKKRGGTETGKDTTSGIVATRIGQEGLNEEWGVVEIEDFVNINPETEVESPWVPPISLEHGTTGVFDIEDLVTLLHSANAFDIVVIRLPNAVQLGDYMVIASAKSLRQLTAISKDIQWIYKQRSKKRNAHLRVEGEKTKWQAMDIGNIFLHLFLPEVREVYDLESLWTMGPEYDEKSREEGTDPYVFSMDDLPWLKELEAGNQAVEETEKDSGQKTRPEAHLKSRRS